MRSVAIPVLALAACNWAYGLEATQLRDAPGPDAPYRCTDAAPKFRGTPVPVITGTPEPSRFYSISIDRRIAVANRASALVEGPGDSSMMTGALLMPAPSLPIGSPRLSPEGDELFIRYAQSLTMATIERYRRQGNLWVRAAQLLTIAANSPDLSSPTRLSAGPRRMMILYSINELHEYVETAADQWTDFGMPYSASEFGSQQILYPNLTPDGLHLVFQGRDQLGLPLMYASRARVEDRFTNPLKTNPFFGSPTLSDPFLLEDCSRLYFFVADPIGVYYVEP